MTAAIYTSAGLPRDQFFSMSSIVKEGYVQVKDCSSFISSFMWSRKYFILREATLGIHKASDSYQAQSVILLKDLVEIERKSYRDYCFEIEVTPNKTLLVACGSEDEMFSWIEAIKNVSGTVQLQNINTIYSAR